MTAPTDAPLTDEQIEAGLRMFASGMKWERMPDGTALCDEVVAVQALRELKAARAELARMRSSFEHVDTQCRRIGDRNAEAMRILGVEFGHPTEGVAEGALRVVTERDSLRDQLTAMTRERDEARANAALEAQHHHHLRKERDEARAQLAASEQARFETESRFAWANQVADRTAEQIAAWLDAWLPGYSLRRDHGVQNEDEFLNRVVDMTAKQIRAGAWRKEGT